MGLEAAAAVPGGGPLSPPAAGELQVGAPHGAGQKAGARRRPEPQRLG